MGGTPRTSDDGAQASPCGRLRISEHIVRHAVCRNHLRFKANAKLLQNLHCVLHGVPVGARTHYHADLNFFHNPEFYFFTPQHSK